MGRTRRAKRQRNIRHRRLPLLPILDEIDLDEADPNTPVRVEVEHQPADVVSCPRCTGVLGMLLTDEDGAHLLGCAVGFAVSCTFCGWLVAPRLMCELE